jgi:SAM-dependent methyltransferase
MNDNSDVAMKAFSQNASSDNLVDRDAHNDLYEKKGDSVFVGKPEDYIRFFEKAELSPFYISGRTKGYVRGLATRSMLEDLRDRAPETVTVVDAGCGTGRLSIYLACKGFNVVAVDISEVAVELTAAFAERLGVADRVRGAATSLADIPVADASVDCIIGHASLHHFIKYSGIPEEFRRVLRPGGACYFADSFGENKLYHLFHNKKLMSELGDVSLTRHMVRDYFAGFSTDMTPTDWFVMFDKLLTSYLPERLHGLVRSISRVAFALDRRIPAKSSIALKLSGSVFTKVTKPEHSG